MEGYNLAIRNYSRNLLTSEHHTGVISSFARHTVKTLIETEVESIDYKLSFVLLFLCILLAAYTCIALVSLNNLVLISLSLDKFRSIYSSRVRVSNPGTRERSNLIRDLPPSYTSVVASAPFETIELRSDRNQSINTVTTFRIENE